MNSIGNENNENSTVRCGCGNDLIIRGLGHDSNCNREIESEQKRGYQYPVQRSDIG